MASPHVRLGRGGPFKFAKHHFPSSSCFNPPLRITDVQFRLGRKTTVKGVSYGQRHRDFSASRLVRKGVYCLFRFALYEKFPSFVKDNLTVCVVGRFVYFWGGGQSSLGPP